MCIRDRSYCFPLRQRNLYESPDLGPVVCDLDCFRSGWLLVPTATPKRKPQRNRAASPNRQHASSSYCRARESGRSDQQLKKEEKGIEHEKGEERRIGTQLAYANSFSGKAQTARRRTRAN